MNIKAFGRFLDQPLLLNKLHKASPFLLTFAGCSYGLFDTYKTSKGQNKDFVSKKVLKNAVIIFSTITASIISSKGIKIRGKKIFPALLPNENIGSILKRQNTAIDVYLSSQGKIEKETKDILLAARKKHLSFMQVKKLFKSIPEGKAQKDLFSVLLPEPDNLDSKAIFSEIGRLSLLGFMPVAAGVLGGVSADKITKTYTRKSFANKIKEGFYQYFANIFLCNIGACIALFIAERLQKTGKIEPLSPLTKMLVIMTGIVSTGILGGSWIANKLSQNLIDPFLNKEKKLSNRKVYDERKPEPVDIALHADDIATAGVLSGFKWIEPMLPLMYFVSGYRAGIGYRNNNV